MGKKSVGVQRDQREPENELWELDEERGRAGARGRRGDVKVLREE